MTVLRSVMIGSIALVAGAAVSCTAPNPAYQRGRSGDAGDEEVETGPALRMPGDGGAPDTAPGAAKCGSMKPALDQLTAVDSLAIDGRGNIYFSVDDQSNGWIGKLPPRGPVEPHWLPVPAGRPTRGMAIDDARRVIYFTAGTATPELDAADLDATPPTVRTLYKGFIEPNDVAVGFDGNIYVTDQGEGHIYSFTTAGKRTQVTTIAIGGHSTSGNGPAGLAFAPDRTLVIGYKGGGQLIRIVIGEAGMELRRATFGPNYSWVNGLAYDQKGRLYVALFDLDGPRDVVRLDYDDAPPVPVSAGGHPSAMACGRGELDCRDLYIADPMAGSPVRRITTDAGGLLIP